MKKYIALLIALIVTVAVTSQTVTYPTLQPDYTFRYVPTDYVITNTTVREFIFPSMQHYKTTQDYIVKMDTVAGEHTSVKVVLSGAKSLVSNSYAKIDSATWYVTTADTVITISNTTANRYRYFKATFTGVGTAKSGIKDQELKLWRE